MISIEYHGVGVGYSDLHRYTSFNYDCTGLVRISLGLNRGANSIIMNFYEGSFLPRYPHSAIGRHKQLVAHR